MSWKSREGEASKSVVMSRKWTLLFCIGCFCAGMIFSDRMWSVPEIEDISSTTRVDDETPKLGSGCDPTIDVENEIPRLRSTTENIIEKLQTKRTLTLKKSRWLKKELEIRTTRKPNPAKSSTHPAAMAPWLIALLCGPGYLALAGVAYLVALPERLVYVPVVPGHTKSYPFTPARLRLTYEDVWLRSSDGARLHAWFIKLSPLCRGPTVLFFQENAGNIAHRLEMVRIMLQKLQCNVFMLSYRGYGASEGYPSQRGIIKDAQVALDHLSQRTDIDTSRIVVFGRSLGGAVGTVVAKNNPDKVAALILENTFTSILDLAGVLFPFLKWCIGGSGSKGPKVLNFLVRSPWRTIDAIGEVKQPILFLSGLQDEKIPPSHLQMLYAKAAAHNKRCVFVEFPTGRHMNTWLAGGDNYWTTVQEFLQQHVPAKKK